MPRRRSSRSRRACMAISSPIWACAGRAAAETWIAFDDAPVVVEARLENQRLLAVAMEPRGVAAAYDESTGGLRVWGCTQIPHGLRDAIAQHLGLPPVQVHLVAPRVGGGFGAKIALYPEDLIVPWLALRLKRPVRWTASRREDLLATSHGRAVVARLRLAADRSGRILALDARIIGNLGWCLFSDGPLLPVLCGQMITGCYDIPAARVEVRCAFTNTMGTAAYRGAGRPEAAFFIERMMDLLAAEVGLDPAEVRRSNFVSRERFPYETAVGTSYDSGNYAGALGALLERAGGAALRAEQQRRRAAGALIGIGLASYVEMCGFVDEETSDVIVDTDGQVSWRQVATAAHGGALPAGIEPGLESREDFVGQGLLYPFGAHLAMVQVDRDTGEVRVLRYVTVDDSGPIVNPLLAAGQVHGGLAQGIGQALWEGGQYDAQGQLLSGSLMDYAIPKADDLPAFETGHTVTPSPRTALGVKGIGESATIGSTPAIANAVLDALRPLGIRHLDIPLTPARIWQAIAAARSG